MGKSLLKVKFFKSLPFIVFSAVLLLLGFKLIDFGNQSIVPFESDTIKIGVYCEGHGEGFSKVSYRVDSNKAVILDYELTNKIEEPFVALYFKNIDTNVFFQFGDFNTLIVELESPKATRIPLTLSNNKSGFTSLHRLFSNIPFTTTIDIKKGKHKYEVPLDDFEITSWWLRKYQFKDDEIPEMNFNRVNLIIIGSCQSLGPFEKDQIKISSLEIHHSNTVAYFLLGGLLIAFGISYGVIKKLNSRKKVLVPYHKVELAPEKTRNEFEEILAFIGLNYNNPELSLSETEKELGISGKNISILIKAKLGLSFKEYLNNLRLAEVKRLLKETNRPISEIAYEVGYNNVTHFNRVFRKYNDMSPKDYRDS